jgi:hypothetical protein
MTVLAGGVAHPLLAGAQQNSKPMPVIGFLGAFPPVMNAQIDLEQAAFRRGLSETGYVEGQNVAIEYRRADGHYDRLPALAADLVARKVDVIVTQGGDGKAGDLDDPDPLPHRQRPGRARHRRQSRPAGRQPDGRQPDAGRADA